MTFEEILESIKKNPVRHAEFDYKELKLVDEQWDVRRGSNGWETLTFQYGENEPRFLQIYTLSDTDEGMIDFIGVWEATRRPITTYVYEKLEEK